MRRLILLLPPISLLACYCYAAYAQPPAPPGAAYQGGRAAAGDWVTHPLQPENCGTPDEPRTCPPMPRHPLPSSPRMASIAGWARV